jgi:hypothetical protein
VPQIPTLQVSAGHPQADLGEAHGAVEPQGRRGLGPHLEADADRGVGDGFVEEALNARSAQLPRPR